LANRLANEFPDKQILIIEKNNRIGGRVLSHVIESGDVIEYGGMRIFKEYHPRITKLLNNLNIEIIPMEHINKKNIFHCKNNIYYNEDIYPQTDKEYFLHLCTFKTPI
jgi:protoporphyrinogen oxidase